MEKDVLNGQTIRVLDQKVAVYTKLKTEGIDLIFPFPSNVVSSASPQWEGNDKGKLNTLASAAMKGAAMETLGGWIDGASEVLSKIKSESAGTMGMIGAAFLGQEQVLHSQRKVLNPFKQMMFSGMDYRTFDLEFEIVTKSAKESENLYLAVKELQVHSMPATFKAEGGLFMHYPDTWNINFLPSNEFLPMFMPSVITNISIDYSGAAGRVVFKKDRAPVSVTISISFAETEIFTREKAEVYYG